MTGDEALVERGSDIVHAAGEVLRRQPMACTQMLGAVDFLLGPTREVVIAGGGEARGTVELQAVLARRFLPRTVVVLKPEDVAEEIVGLAGYVEDHVSVEGRATAYICRDYACQEPVTTPEDLSRLLEDGPG